MACKKIWIYILSTSGPIETQGSCTAAETISQRAHACYSSDMCGHSTSVYSYVHILSMSIRYFAVEATPGGCSKYMYWYEIKYVIDFAVFVLRVSMSTLKFKFDPVIRIQ